MASVEIFGGADGGKAGAASTEQASEACVADGPGLADLIAGEDEAEAQGHLDPDRRLTCHTCRAWATHAHVSSGAHWQAIRRVAAGQGVEVDHPTWCDPDLCTVQPDRSVSDGVHLSRSVKVDVALIAFGPTDGDVWLQQHANHDSVHVVVALPDTGDRVLFALTGATAAAERLGPQSS